MENPVKKQSKPGVLGKISLSAGIINFLLFILSYIYLRFYIEYTQGFQIIIAALFIFLTVGITTGIIALIKERAWLGFAVNLTAGVLLAAAFLLVLVVVLYGGYAAAKNLGLLP